MLTVLAMRLVAQQPVKLLDPAKARKSYSFPLRPGEEPLRFEVQVNGASSITDVKVFRFEQPSPFQVLPACKPKDGLTMQLTEYDSGRELLKHQDLNFDGYQDLELLHYYVPHLAKSLFCIYVWDAKADQFRAAPEIPEVDPIADPKTKSIAVHEDFFGGVFIDSVYKWSGRKLVLTSQSGRVYGSKRLGCGFTDFCSELINGKLVDSVSEPAGCGDVRNFQLVCPASISKQLRASPLQPQK